MLIATLLALVAAGLHAGWNLLAKRSPDPFLALWGQFFVAGVIGAVGVAVAGMPARGWVFAAVTGIVHIPYVAGLAHAYTHGDFSLAYPIARGGGALLAGIGGIVLLGDELTALAVVAVVVVTAGITMLAAGAEARQVSVAILVAVTIGVYTVNDSHAAREVGAAYPFAVFVGCGVFVTAYGVATGRSRSMVAALRARPGPFTLTATMAVVTYGLVLLAVRRAPVGYVAVLRESSVIIAAYLGARYLDERDTRRRAMASIVVVGGLVLLVLSA